MSPTRRTADTGHCEHERLLIPDLRQLQPLLLFATHPPFEATSIRRLPPACQVQELSNVECLFAQERLVKGGSWLWHPCCSMRKGCQPRRGPNIEALPGGGNDSFDVLIWGSGTACWAAPCEAHWQKPENSEAHRLSLPALAAALS